MHENLKQDAEENDLVPQLLDHIVDKMLRTSEWRPNAPTLWHDSQSILDNPVDIFQRAQIDAPTSSKTPKIFKALTGRRSTSRKASASNRTHASSNTARSETTTSARDSFDTAAQAATHLWLWENCPAYRLAMTALYEWLTRKFGPHEFRITVSPVSINSMI